MLYIFLLLVINCIAIGVKPEEKLLFVWEHFRHGARASYRSFKNWTDVLKEKWDGEGELTPMGMRMLYLLGVSTKKKYQNFLSENFDPNEILIKSTDVNRTIISAYSFLQGLYDNKTSQNLTQKQIELSNIPNSNYSKLIKDKKEEIGPQYDQGGRGFYPVYIFPTNFDHLFQIFRANECPGIKKNIDELSKSETIKKMIRETCDHINKTYGEYIFKFMNKSGVKEPDYLYDYSTLFDIADTFIADYFNGRKLKHIIDTGIDLEKFYVECLNLSFIQSYYKNFGYPVTKLLYFGVSPVFRTLFNYMEMRIELDKKGESEKKISISPKFVVTAGHDTTLAANDLFLKKEFNVPFERAEYSHSQFYELWKNEADGKYLIKYLVNHKLRATFDYQDFKAKVLPTLYPQENINKICNGEMDL